MSGFAILYLLALAAVVNIALLVLPRGSHWESGSY